MRLVTHGPPSRRRFAACDLPLWGRTGWLALLLALLLFPALAFAAPGPVWWKITNGGGSTLWILGIPDGALESLRWNQDALKLRLGAADALVMPILENEQIGPIGPCPFNDAVPTYPGADAKFPCSKVWAFTMARTSWQDPLSRRLPPALLARLRAATPAMLGDSASAFDHARTLDVALWLDLWNWPRGDNGLGNPITLAAFRLGRARFVKTTLVPEPRLRLPRYYSVYSAAVYPPEAVQQACLEKVLDDTESGEMPALRVAGLTAWANGDLDHALMRTSTVHYCLMGEMNSSSAQDYLRKAAYRYYTRLDKAFDAPGQTVALVEFDPLLLKSGGVLDHYRRLAYDITTSDGMEQ